MSAKKEEDDLVGAGSEYSFRASDPPSYMAGGLIAGLPSRDGPPSRAPANHELSDPDDAKPAAHAPLGTDPARIGKAPAQPGFGGNNPRQAITPLTWVSDLNASSHHPEPIGFAWVQPAVLRSPALWASVIGVSLQQWRSRMARAPSSGKSSKPKETANATALRRSRPVPCLETPNLLSSQATEEIAAALTALLADSLALYLKTKNFHWHVSGPHFRDYHLMFDEQAAEIFAMTDPLAERARKIGGTTLRSIGHIARQQRLLDNDAGYVEPADMLAELLDDNKQLAAFMRQTHDLCDDHDDVATESLLEEFIDQTEKRIWFLFETSRGMQTSGH